MLWRGRRESENVDDRRSFSGGHLVAGGGIVGVIIYLISLFMGGDSSLSQLQQQLPGTSQPMSAEEQAKDDERAHFVKVVLAETEDIWTKIMGEQGRDYPKPVLVLFRDGVESACGSASTAVGPFYCPGDQHLYIDLSFFEELQNRFHAPGDFPMAYVIAHEVGHHIQYLMGLSEKMDRLRSQLSEREFNRYSVKMELQADFYAGVWAHYAAEIPDNLEPGDIEEALNAANAIGDDKLQQEAQGRIVPDAFTHGTSEQRMYWFKKGYDTGDIQQGNTFNDQSL